MSTDIRHLIRDLLPTAPEIGLFVAPDIPADKIRGATGDFATSVKADDVLALFDATYNGSAKDGVVFTRDRLVFQNHDWSPVQEIRYEDIVQVESRKRFIGGRKVYVDANRGRATVKFTIDFSGKPKAAEYVARFLQEAMMATIIESTIDSGEGESQTDVDAVHGALSRLLQDGKLSQSDLNAMIAVIKPR